MGNTPSNLSSNRNEDIWWGNDYTEEVRNERPRTESFDRFSEDFNKKRQVRKQILEQKRIEIKNVREELEFLRRENERLKRNTNQAQTFEQDEQLEFLRRQNQTLLEEINQLKAREVDVEDIMKKNSALRMSVSEMQCELQRMNSSLLDFEDQKKDYKKHVVALKDVIKVSKELLQIREAELKQLKDKLRAIESAFNERETLLMSNDLKREYEKQLQNIRSLRELYEERSRTHKREAAILKSNLEDKEKELEKSTLKLRELQERIDDLEKDTSDKYDTIKSLESNMGLVKAEARQYQAELAVINQLFSHILLAFNNSPELDFDRLLKRLEENHDLLKDIVNNEVSSEVSSALPKVLLDLVNQMSTENESDDIEDRERRKELAPSEPTSSSYNLNSPAEIAENLPKVWRVLIELLSHQATNVPEHELSEEEDENRCFKTVTTPKGPSLVLSVSKTFFRLKELIVEKKNLEKDMNNLKQLNSHLESRLQEQEKRFEFVSTELSKTWNFVGKLQKEHKLLHTQEQILRYELAQKRKLLKELKQELEYSREKWQQAREKNSKTEKEWLILRKEFAARRRTTVEDGSNSVESGFSDEREGSSDEEPGYETDISECNVKVEGTVEDDVEKETVLENDAKSSISKNEYLDDSINVATSSNCSILNVIQNEITDISTILSTDTVQNDEQNKEPIEFRTDNQENNFQEVIDTESSNMNPSISNDSSDQPSTSSTSARTLEERLAARDERLKRLEGQCKALVSQVTNTSNKSLAICSKLEDLHEIYGESSKDSMKKSTDEKKTDDEES